MDRAAIRPFDHAQDRPAEIDHLRLVAVRTFPRFGFVAGIRPHDYGQPSAATRAADGNVERVRHQPVKGAIEVQIPVCQTARSFALWLGDLLAGIVGTAHDERPPSQS